MLCALCYSVLCALCYSAGLVSQMLQAGPPGGPGVCCVLCVTVFCVLCVTVFCVLCVTVLCVLCVTVFCVLCVTVFYVLCVIVLVSSVSCYKQALLEARECADDSLPDNLWPQILRMEKRREDICS